MGTINTYTAYHATDKKKVQSILDNNFIYNYHDDHWLGNGVYFFLDAGLAEQWANKTPTNRYGAIENPVIIQAVIKVDSDHVADLRNLSDHNYVKRLFDSYYETLLKSGKKLAGDNSKEKLRCAFFDWFMKKTDTHSVISYFDERKNLSEYTEHGNIYNTFHIPYVEVQMCVSRIDCIVAREVVDFSPEKEI